MPAERTGALLLVLAASLAPAPSRAQEAPPSPELLEFLGELDTDDGEMTELEILAGSGSELPIAAPAAERSDDRD